MSTEVSDSPSVAARLCPVCTAPTNAPAFCASVPILLNVVVRDRSEALAAERGRIVLHECRACGFVWNAAFDGVPYDERYVVDASRSSRYRVHLDAMTDAIVDSVDADAPFDVVEVGAGQGGFLERLNARHPARIRHALGLDPAYRAGEIPLSPNVTMRPYALDAWIDQGERTRADVIVARHLIEHVADPVEFLRRLAVAFGASGPFELFIETPNVDCTLEAGLLHDFCYEHCSMFGARALRVALARAGYGQIEVRTAFDGEYLVASAKSTSETTASTASGAFDSSEHGAHPPRLAALGATFVATHVAFVEAARERGAVVGWGAAGKGALFAWLVDPDASRIDGIVDIHEGKHGSYLPGAAHRVLSPDEARALGARTVIVSNPTYLHEVRDACRRAGIEADVVCVGGATHVSPSDSGERRG